MLPIEDDGSFHIQVPASTPIAFELLDAEGRVVARQNEWAWVMPREWRGCIGCHEDRELVPPNVLAEAIVLNYLALHGEVGNLGAVLPGHGLGSALDPLIAFAPLPSVTGP